jgi:hypothetical protein
MAKGADIFDEDGFRSDGCNKSQELEPQRASLSLESCTSASKADVLAREAARDDVDVR